MSRSVTFKWGKVPVVVNLDDGETLDTLKAKIQTQTNVPGDRQKIMVKGRLIKDDAGVSAITGGSQGVLMGTADEIVIDGPKTKVIFEEDLNTEQKSKLNVARDIPGYKNLGNTCYMNATLQCLRTVPELRNALSVYSQLHPFDPREATNEEHANHALLTYALDQLYKSQDKSENAVVPNVFVQTLRRAHPQFNERSRTGTIHAQQDADECFSQLLHSLASQLKDVPTSRSINDGHNNWVDMLFSMEMTATLTPKDPECEGERVMKSVEEHRKLRCTIGSNTNYMIEGIKEGLIEAITKRSPKLKRDALYERKSAITRLPKYLVVHFVRFFWRTDNNKKTKIIRRVQFPLKFDILDLTGGDLKDSLIARRALLNQEQEKQLGIAGLNTHKDKAKANNATSSSSSSSSSSPSSDGTSSSSSAMTDGDATTPTSSPSTEEKKSESDKKVEPHPYTSGNYDLCALVTHKGRDADSGHYVGWVKADENKWAKYDDDVVSPVDDEEVLKLCGGGDWHTAYIAIYKRIDDVAK